MPELPALLVLVSPELDEVVPAPDELDEVVLLESLLPLQAVNTKLTPATVAMVLSKTDLGVYPTDPPSS